MKKLFSFGVAAFMITSCSTTKDLHVKEFVKAQNELTGRLTQISETASFNGFGIALVNDREVLYQNGFGVSDIKASTRYTDNTVQNIASVSKTVIGIAILKAQELGKLNLDDPVNKYLPFNVSMSTQMLGLRLPHWSWRKRQAQLMTGLRHSIFYAL